MSKPIIAANSPSGVELVTGKNYAFCACGRSLEQPFCDGSHGGTGLFPMVFRAEKDGIAYLCRCKTTGNAPFCDGSHDNVSADQVGRESS
ncbi:MAG: hypothetical protein F7B06_09695 [Opitutae bacterium]|nr:hypothetical protein [Opitutae bacterium]